VSHPPAYANASAEANKSPPRDYGSTPVVPYFGLSLLFGVSLRHPQEQNGSLLQLKKQSLVIARPERNLLP
jgi:hypothetical protein